MYASPRPHAESFHGPEMRKPHAMHSNVEGKTVCRWTTSLSSTLVVTGRNQKRPLTHPRELGPPCWTLGCRFRGGRILAEARWHLGCPSQVAGPSSKLERERTKAELQTSRQKHSRRQRTCRVGRVHLSWVQASVWAVTWFYAARLYNRHTN